MTEEHKDRKPAKSFGQKDGRPRTYSSGNNHSSGDHGTGGNHGKSSGQFSGRKDGERRGPYGRPAGGENTKRSFGRTFPGNGERKGSYGRPAPKTESTGLSMNARRVALDILNDVHENGAYASLSLDEHLRTAKLNPADRRLVTGIVYGTLENQLRIDYVLDKLMDHPTHEPIQRDILRLSAYQILFLDRVPDSAAVNEGVNLVKTMGMENASGFVNAVLRNLARGKDSIEWPARDEDTTRYISIMTGTPEWLVQRLTEDYGCETAEKILSWRENEHPIVVRPNMLKIDDAAFDKLLEKKNWRVEKGLAPHARLVYGAQEITFDEDYKNGMFSIQGQSSILAAEAVGARAGMKVLDACAAPGGKSAYLCETMQLTGRVFSWELHENRVLLLEGVRRRLGLDSMRIACRNASVYREELDSTLDAVLLDAPCSGLGVLTQKPDIKLRLKPEDLPAITETQSKLLDTVCRYVRPGGVLVYSTCSILPMENSDQIRAFLQRHPEYEIESLPDTLPAELLEKQTDTGLQLLGCRDGVEGFFMARMRRKA